MLLDSKSDVDDERLQGFTQTIVQGGKQSRPSEISSCQVIPFNYFQSLQTELISFLIQVIPTHMLCTMYHPARTVQNNPH